MREHLAKWLNTSDKNRKISDMLYDLPVNLIKTNPLQPRTIFDDAKINELASTIRTHGLLQPIIVRKKGDGYELIAGERRLRAALKLGLSSIPAIVKDLSDAQAATMSLIENLQREGLTAVEEAIAYQHFLENYHFTQETLAQRLGKSQSTIANKLRLLNLSPEVQQAVLNRTISERHARALLALDHSSQALLLNEILRKGFTVAQTEARVKYFLEKNRVKKRSTNRLIARDARLAINTIRESLRVIEQSGFIIYKKEIDEPEFIEFVIKVPKHRV